MARYEYPNSVFKVADLRIGDVIKQLDGPFGTAIVKQVGPEEVLLFRPYGTNSGFVMSGDQTICYTGIEETEFLKTDKAEFLVYQRENFDA